jgi:thiol-disulfide isomerase/thioredoxin
MFRDVLVTGFMALLVLSGVPAATQTGADADIVATVRAAVTARDFPRGEELLAKYRAVHGTTPEAIAALSWMARGALAARQLDSANRYAVQTYDQAVAALKRQKLDQSEHLQTALGAAIETQALVLAQSGARSDAVYLLRRELQKYHDTPIHKRLAKNLNLLSLEGQPVMPLDRKPSLERAVPSFAQLKGKVVVLFFWAHWCPDCKIEGPILARLIEKYRTEGLAIVAPTQRYGYMLAGQAAQPADELRHIIQVRDTYYPFLREEPVPLSDANHKRYGVSSTPTIVLVDRGGIVRLYHPGRMTEEELETAIVKLLRPPA